MTKNGKMGHDYWNFFNRSVMQLKLYLFKMFKVSTQNRIHGEKYLKNLLGSKNMKYIVFVTHK